MSQPITIGSTLGMIQIPWFEKDADALKAAPAYNAAGLTVQLVIGETFYSYTSASPASIVEYVAGTKETPADNTEIVWRVPDASSNVALVYVHSSLYDTLNIADGQTIGHITASADTYGAVASTLGFSKGISVDDAGMVGVSEFANNTITPASILDGALDAKGDWSTHTAAEAKADVSLLALEATSQSIKGETDKIGTLTEDSDGLRYTAKALEQAPVATGFAVAGDAMALTPAERTAVRNAMEVVGGKLDTAYRRRSRLRKHGDTWYMDIVDGYGNVAVIIPLQQATLDIPAFDRAGEEPTS